MINVISLGVSKRDVMVFSIGPCPKRNCNDLGRNARAIGESRVQRDVENGVCKSVVVDTSNHRGFRDSVFRDLPSKPNEYDLVSAQC